MTLVFETGMIAKLSLGAAAPWAETNFWLAVAIILARQSFVWACTASLGAPLARRANLFLTAWPRSSTQSLTLYSSSARL